MIIDLHFHTKQYSPCSSIDMEEGVRYAKKLGLDGICITDHDVFACRKRAEEIQKKYNILVIVGTEILTMEGDLLCFGLDEIPKEKLAAQTLIDKVNAIGGACIAAHPYRENNRGMGAHLDKLTGLHAIESYNGNTKCDNNTKAVIAASRLGIPCIGGSDAHRIERVGVYATRFFTQIENEKDIISAIRSGRIEPACGI